MNKTNKYLILFLAIGFFSQGANAQVKVGDNPTTIHSSAAIEIESTTKGLLPPRMTSAQRDALSNPAVGLIIFNITSNCLNHYIGPNWFEVCGVELPRPAVLGSSFTTYTNGSENFSDNTTCQNKLISAGYSSATCSGNVVVGANTYPVVLINGQCWMQTNLKEASTAPCAAAINTNCNIWLNTSPGDIGSWGYYNTVTTNGTAGWGTTEPAAGEGLLYQWSAAMNGSTTERAQGVCPTGWHIPSDCEWMFLEHGQGMSIVEQNKNNNWRNTTGEGHKLRGVGLSFTNSSGFTALLAGFRDEPPFSSRGTYGFWWSSSVINSTLARGRSLNGGQAGVDRASCDKALGFSVRCLKD